jgi:hypothetical protein
MGMFRTDVVVEEYTTYHLSFAVPSCDLLFVVAVTFRTYSDRTRFPRSSVLVSDYDLRSKPITFVFFYYSELTCNISLF